MHAHTRGRILRAVSIAYDVPERLMTSSSQKAAALLPRYAAAAILRARTTASQEQIGEALGGRHPSTISEGLTQHRALMQTDDTYGESYREALRLLDTGRTAGQMLAHVRLLLTQGRVAEAYETLGLDPQQEAA